MKKVKLFNAKTRQIEKKRLDEVMDIQIILPRGYYDKSFVAFEHELEETIKAAINVDLITKPLYVRFVIAEKLYPEEKEDLLILAMTKVINLMIEEENQDVDVEKILGIGTIRDAFKIRLTISLMIKWMNNKCKVDTIGAEMREIGSMWKWRMIK